MKFLRRNWLAIVLVLAVISLLNSGWHGYAGRLVLFGVHGVIQLGEQTYTFARHLLKGA